jgi:hypothetical protein
MGEELTLSRGDRLSFAIETTPEYGFAPFPAAKRNVELTIGCYPRPPLSA